MRRINNENEIFIVEVTLEGFKDEKYYLADFEYSLSRNIRDSIIFINENNAHKFASIIETKYLNSLGRVEKNNLNKVVF